MPEPPTELKVEVINAFTVRLTWTPPVYNGGKSVFNYLVSYKERSTHRKGKKEGYSWGPLIQVRARHHLAILTHASVGATTPLSIPPPCLRATPCCAAARVAPATL